MASRCVWCCKRCRVPDPEQARVVVAAKRLLRATERDEFSLVSGISDRLLVAVALVVVRVPTSARLL